MLYLTSGDQKILQNSLSLFASRLNSMRRETDLGGQIASLRYWILERGNDGRAINEQRLLLCKLVYEAKLSDPEALTKYFIFPSSEQYNRSLRDLPIVAALRSPYYDKQREYEGFGTWANKQHELVFADLCNYISGQVHVISREQYKSLISAFERQVSDAEAAKDIPMVGSVAERKAAGRCYRCGCQKPRKVPCIVCGYVPLGGV